MLDLEPQAPPSWRTDPSSCHLPSYSEFLPKLPKGPGCLGRMACVWFKAKSLEVCVCALCVEPSLLLISSKCLGPLEGGAPLVSPREQEVGEEDWGLQGPLGPQRPREEVSCPCERNASKKSVETWFCCIRDCVVRRGFAVVRNRRDADWKQGCGCAVPSSLAMWAETKQPAPLLVKVTLGPLIWAIKGAMNPPHPPSSLRSAWLENSGHSVSNLDCTETHKSANFS